jgi:hypothetical protein
MTCKHLSLILLGCLLLLSFSSTVYAVSWSTPALFSFSNGCTVGLTSASATYDSATNDGSTVSFTNFQLGAESVGTFGVSLSGNNITLTQVSYVTSISGVTNQLGQILLTVPKPVTVYSNSVLQTEGVGWSYSGSTLTINSASTTFFVSYSATITPQSQVAMSSFFNGVFAAALIGGIIPFVILAAAVITFMKNTEPEILLKAVILTVIVSICVVVTVVVIGGVQTALPTA